VNVDEENEQKVLRSAALKNAESILLVRQRAERELLATKEALERTSEELREVRARLEHTLATAEIGTWTWDVRKNRLTTDQNLARMFSMDSNGAAAGALEEFLAAIHPNDREQVQRAISRALSGENDNYELDCRLLRADGSVRWISARGRVQRDSTGAASHFPGVVIDITDRKRAEEAVREGAERLQLALAAGTLGDWSWDARTDLFSVGARAAEILGLSATSPVTRAQIQERMSRHDREQANLAFQEALATRSDYNVEFRMELPGGHHRWVAARGRGLYADNGLALGMTGVAQDISDRKQAEEIRILLAAVVASSDDAIISKTLDGIITSWNRGAQRMFGYAPDEVIGQPVTLLIPPDHLDEEPGILQRLRRGERIEHYETVRRRKDGALLNVSLSVSPVRDVNGTIVGASKIARDVTHQRRAEQAMRASEVRFRLMADSAPVLIWIADTSKACTWFNKAWLEFSNRTMEQELGFGWVQNIHPDDLDRFLHVYSEHFEARTAFKAEYRFRRHDGEWRWLIDNAVPLYEGSDGTFSGYIGSCVDITEFRQAATEREQLLISERAARSEAERVGRMKDEFLATLSHELRTPLNAILGWATLLRRVQVGSDDYVKGLETIERNARVQTQIIADLLDMSRIISGKVQLDVQPVDLHEVISAALDAVRPSADAKHVRLRATLDAKAGRIRGDASRLQQVFWNLLTNAVKFTPAAGRIDVVLERVNSHVEVSIEDSGIGIKPEFLAFVFDRFRQADASITRRHGGLGLGLSIVKHLIELHGGTVRVKSPGEGQGATFIVALPISVARASDSGRQERPDFADVDLFSVGLPSLAGVTVLVVDDEPDARVLVSRILEERGARVLNAQTGEEALKMLNTESVDILVSDIGMPDYDGYKFIQHIRRDQPKPLRNIPAIALTAYARADDRQRALLAGYQMHLAKPIEPRELIAGIASLLNVPYRLHPDS
jgi:PAS domain S-box-containing protein